MVSCVSLDENAGCHYKILQTSFATHSANETHTQHTELGSAASRYPKLFIITKNTLLKSVIDSAAHTRTYKTRYIRLRIHIKILSHSWNEQR